MKVHKSLDNTHIAPWVLLPLRLFFAVTFLYAGIQKFTDPQFLHPGTIGFIGRQMLAYAKGSPIGGLLTGVVVPHALLFGYLVAFGEIAIGLGVLFGFLLRPAAFFGMLLSLIFFLSVTWHVYPYFYGADIVFVFGWLTLLLNGPLNTGLPTLDAYLTLHFLPRFSPERQTGLAGVLHFILGTTPERSRDPNLDDITESLPIVGGPQMQRQQMRQQQQRQIAARIEQEKRRSFLRGSLTGGAGILGLGALFYVVRALVLAYENTGTDQTTVTGAPTQSASTPTASASDAKSAPTADPTPAKPVKGTIAQVKAVPSNSAKNFTIASSGDPGILIHLDGGHFVAYDALCTHAGCQVDYDPSQQLIVCPCHGAAYDPAKAAEVVQGPAPTPLAPVSIRVDSATGAIILA
ncbi:MAG TPA: TQO small subunit DoxD [Ktedonobacteraceae bacterium]|nr:TQO small subunit DoxD [Ktedonobacteraceae bacterium]